MSMRRYVLVRAAWQVGVLFAFVSLAYLAAFVVPKSQLGRDPGYGGFLGDLARGSLGRSVGPQPGTVGPSVRSIVWDASRVTLSFLLVTASSPSHSGRCSPSRRSGAALAAGGPGGRHGLRLAAADLDRACTSRSTSAPTGT